MRTTLVRAVLGAAILATVALPPAAQAQVRGRTYRGTPQRYSVYRYGPAVQPVFGAAPVVTSITFTGGAVVPDGGSVTLASYTQVSEGRTEFGVPGLGQLPYIGRGFRNVGTGRSTLSVRVGIGARIIDLEEEEERQTGERRR
jgi:hypothetical protein